MGFVAEAVILEELGRGLFPGPYLPTVLALSALEGDRELAERVVSGTAAATVAIGDDAHVVAERYDDGWRLSGDAMFVPDIDAAALVVVAAEAADEPGLYCVEASADGSPASRCRPSTPRAGSGASRWRARQRGSW